MRQALAEDSANQLRELGIDVTTSGVGWDTAYSQAHDAIVGTRPIAVAYSPMHSNFISMDVAYLLVALACSPIASENSPMLSLCQIVLEKTPGGGADLSGYTKTVHGQGNEQLRRVEIRVEQLRYRGTSASALVNCGHSIYSISTKAVPSASMTW